MIEENKTNNSDKVVSDTESVVKEVTPKKKRKKKFILLYVAVFVFAVYAMYALITQYSQIEKKRSQLDSLNKQISVQEIKNDEITNIYNLSDKDNEDYIEQKAKEDGYLHAGERVFVNISGD